MARLSSSSRATRLSVQCEDTYLAVRITGPSAKHMSKILLQKHKGLAISAKIDRF